MGQTSVANIGAGGRRRRALLGGAGLAVGAAAVAAVAAAELSPGWTLLAFVPFTFAMLGFRQAQKCT